MKATILSLLLVCALPTLAVERVELDNEIRILGAKLEALQAQPGKRIPDDILYRAEAVILLEPIRRGGLSDYEGGGGVAMVRNPVNGTWSPAAFMMANAASLGFQVSPKEGFIAILLMNTNATRLLIDPTFEYGAVTQAGSPVVSLNQTVLVFDDLRGFLGATSAQPGAFMANDDANRIYYGASVTARNILFDRLVRPTAATIELTGKIIGHSLLPYQ